MRTTPERITRLEPDEVFVFGSNYAGRHGRGAAKDALKFGAKWGTGTGWVGQTYGIATKDQQLRVLPLAAIEVQVQRFLRVAATYSGHTFLVTPIGCGLAGFSPRDIAPMFAWAPPNVVLPECFVKELGVKP